MSFRIFGNLSGILIAIFCLASQLEATVSKTDSLRWILEQEAPDWSPDRLPPLFLELGKAYLDEGDAENAFEQFNRGLKLAKNNQQKALAFQFMLHMGHAYYVAHDFDQAFKQYQSFLEAVGSQITPEDAAITQAQFSKIQLANGNYDKAYKAGTEVLLIRENMRDSLGIALARVEIGNIHFVQENYELALKDYHESLMLAEQINNLSAQRFSYSALSKTYKNLDEKDKALFYNKKALQIAEAENDPRGIAAGKNNIALLYLELGLYELAAENFKDALQAELALNNTHGQINSLLGVGTAMVQMGEAEKSLNYLDEAQCLALQLGLPHELSNIYKILAEANAKLGNEAEGYHFLNAYVMIKDTLVTERAMKEMGVVKNEYELQSRENQIALLSAERNLLAKEKKIKGLYWFLLFVMIAFFTATGFVVLSKAKMQNRLLKLLEHKSKKIKEQNGKLAQSNLDLQQFASVASHDLREPLRMINSYTKLLNRKYSDSFDASAKEFMHFITDAATRMDRMLTDLLDYSRAQNKGERAQWISSQELVGLALDNLKFKIDKKQVKINYQKSHLPNLYCNKTAMIQLFQNLIGNAVKFTNEASPEVIIDCQKKGGHYCFSIRDNGIGIKAENQSKIFDMFQRLHSQQEFEGTGIGLATCKKIVERHRGKIWVESKEGDGSTFFFTIPQDVSAN